MRWQPVSVDRVPSTSLRTILSQLTWCSAHVERMQSTCRPRTLNMPTKCHCFTSVYRLLSSQVYPPHDACREVEMKHLRHKRETPSGPRHIAHLHQTGQAARPARRGEKRNRKRQPRRRFHGSLGEASRAEALISLLACFLSIDSGCSLHKAWLVMGCHEPGSRLGASRLSSTARERARHGARRRHSCFLYVFLPEMAASSAMICAFQGRLPALSRLMTLLPRMRV